MNMRVIGMLGVIVLLHGLGFAHGRTHDAANKSETCRRGKNALAKALEKAKAPSPQIADAHHIVAQHARAAHPAKVALDRLSMCINDAENGIFLAPEDHKWLHSCDDYYPAVNRALESANTSDEARASLTKLKADIAAAVQKRECGLFGAPIKKKGKNASSESSALD